MDNAAQASRGLPPADAALASAIAGETLRRLPDLDALIDGATRQKLPDDSKARMVLRLALAQKIGLGTPDHALVATALPLVDGGPRRLVHGVLGTLLRKGLPQWMRRACPTRRAALARPGGDDVVAASPAPSRIAPARPQLSPATRPAMPSGRHFARPAPSPARIMADP
jgi:16S rRNA (cytosine967-C5)-methyltransferase